MNRFIFLLILLVRLSLPALSQSEPVIPPEQLRADLEQMRTMLEDWHPGYAMYRSRDSLRQRFEEISRQIDRPMTARQFMRVARIASAQIQCLHTSVSLPVSKGSVPKTVSGSPLANVYLTANNQLIKRTSGDTIRYLNGRSTKVIADSLLLFFTSDGPNPSLKRWAVNRQFPAVYAARFGAVDTLTLQVDSAKGLVEERYIAVGVKTDSVPTYLANQPHKILCQGHDFTLYALDKYPAVAVLQLRSIGGILDQHKLGRAFQLLQQQSVQHLVLDMRNNTGGRIWTATNLLARLLPKPTTLSFDRYRSAKGRVSIGIGNQFLRFLYAVKLKLHTAVSRTEERVRYTYNITPKKEQFTGTLTVLINGGTASAASLIAAYLREQNRAVFIGEETGGSRFVSAGMQVPAFRLKYSGVRLRVPFFQVIHTTRMSNSGHGILPDLIVPEWQLHIDSVMQKALEPPTQAVRLVTEPR